MREVSKKTKELMRPEKNSFTEKNTITEKWAPETPNSNSITQHIYTHIYMLVGHSFLPSKK
jgi:hypothetical protein